MPELLLPGQVPSLGEVMLAPAEAALAAELDRTVYAQAGLFAVQVATARLWARWGVVPELVLGHSVGELAALHVAGVLGLSEACGLVTARARGMEAMASGGAMASVEASEAEVRAVLGEAGSGR